MVVSLARVARNWKGFRMAGPFKTFRSITRSSWGAVKSAPNTVGRYVTFGRVQGRAATLVGVAAILFGFEYVGFI